MGRVLAAAISVPAILLGARGLFASRAVPPRAAPRQESRAATAPAQGRGAPWKGRSVDLPFPRLALYTQARVNPTPDANRAGQIRSYADPRAADLARYDLLLLDANYIYWYPGLLDEIRRRNPSALLVCSWEAVWTYENWLGENERRNDIPFHRGIRRDPRFIPDWFVRGADGKAFLDRHTTSFPPESDIVWTDPTEGCPPNAKGMRFGDFLVDRIAEELRAFPEYDGFMWDAVRHYGERGMDLDRDGREDSHAERVERWGGGMARALGAVAGRFPEKLFLYQSGQVAFEDTPASFRAHLNGDILPEFPRPSWKGSRAGDLVAYWTEGLAAQLRWLEEARAPGVGWICGGKTWQGRGEDTSHYDYARVRYTLGSACLVDAFAGYDGGDNGHHLRWWYDEYDGCGLGKGWLGRPLGPAFAADDRGLLLPDALARGSARTIASHLWRRDFENGIVVVNPATPGDLVRRSDADAEGWIELAFADLKPGSVEVADTPGFQRPWTPGKDFEVDERRGRLRPLSREGGRAASAPFHVRYAVGSTERAADLGEPFLRLLGAQDRGANDGSTVRRLAVPGRDARFLLRPSFAERNGVAILLDDRSPEFSTRGSRWRTGGAGHFASEIAGGGANRYDRSFLWVPNDGLEGANHSARWTPSFERGGRYEVSFYAPHETALHGGLAASSLRFVVREARGLRALEPVDHVPFAHDWQPLGVFEFAAGSEGYVELQANGGGGALVADAVRFRPVAR